jgi:tetratricopeptide (TPR) repeat protein
MLRRFILFILLFSTISYGQKTDSTKQKEIEQLEKELTNISGEKEGVILLKLSELYWKVEPQKGINYGKKAILYYQENDIDKLPDAYINSAVAFYYHGELDSTIYYTKRILHLNNQELSTHHLGVIYNILCVAYKNKGSYGLALENGEKALKYFQESNDSTRIPGTLDNIANIYNRMGNYQKSLQYSLESLRAFEKNNDLYDVAITHSNIADLYSNIKKYDKSKQHLTQALAIIKKTDDDYFLADVYNNLGSLYTNTQKPDSAFYYYNKALQFYKKANVKKGIAVATQNIGSSYINKGEYSKGIPFLTDAYSVFTKLHANEDLIDVSIDLGKAYLQTGQTDLARKYLYQSLQLSKKIKNIRLRLKILEQLQDLAVKNKQFEQAYKYQKQFFKLRDSVNSIEAQRQIADLDKKYQNEKKEKEIEKLRNKENVQKVKNNSLMILVGSLIGLILLASYFIYQKRKKETAISKLELEQSHLQQQQLEQELEYKNKQLATHAINIMQRNKLLQNYLNILDEIKLDDTSQTSVSYKSLKREINKTIQSKKDWESFKTYFEETNKSFVDNLIRYNPNLTNNDFRLAALIKLGMTNKEIASIFNISSQSVKNGLYRLKKKMQIADSENLRSFLKKL